MTYMTGVEHWHKAQELFDMTQGGPEVQKQHTTVLLEVIANALLALCEFA